MCTDVYSGAYRYLQVCLGVCAGAYRCVQVCKDVYLGATGVCRCVQVSVQVCVQVCTDLFVADSQPEGDPSSKLVPLVAGGQRVGVDFALYVDVRVQRHVQELDGHQRLSVVDLRQ